MIISSLVVACSLFDSKFGKVFGDGNVGSFFDNFERQHNCNENIFCKYFDIAGIYDAASFV